MKIFLYAPNVHQGGGRTLITALVGELGSHSCELVLDERLELGNVEASKHTHALVAPKLLSRIAAEWRLRKAAGAGDVILSFGNLPPIFSTQAKVFVYLQNYYLISTDWRTGLPWRLAAKIAVERVWLRLFLRSATIIVQTPTMERRTRDALARKPVVMPFIAGIVAASGGETSPSKQHDFLYVASGEPHKNHKKLVQSWSLLAADGIRPSLALTLDPENSGAMLEWINEQAKLHDLNIINLGTVPPTDVSMLYQQSRALIYPSFFESFGLPLIEANEHGIPVLAPELDYVRDVIEPVETFDPNSHISMAKAVKRHLLIEDRPEATSTAKEFVQNLLSSLD